MKVLRNPILIVVGLLALALIVTLGCNDKPKAPETNAEPNTIITTYQINTLPDSGTVFTVTVYWRAYDIDGQAEYYRYWVGASNVPDNAKTGTYDTFASLQMDFATNANIYTFNVQARDDRDQWDSTPATIQINMADTRHGTVFNPNTTAGTVPPDGALTSAGVHLVINGDDLDGEVVTFQRAIDDTSSWVDVTPQVILEHQSTVEMNVSGLSLGPHIIYVRAVDNMGNVDNSPLSLSIDVRDGFAPEVSLSVRNDESFVVPFTTPTMDTLQITITSTVDFYYGAIRDYYIFSSTGMSDTTTDNVVNLTNLGGGTYWIKVVANDYGGNSTADSTNFGIVVLGAHQGILGVNGIDWATYGEAVDVWDNAVPFGNFPHFKWWDLFLVPPSGGRPYADSLLGTGSIPEWMLDTTYFSAVVWFANEYSGDEVYWNARTDAIMNYLNNGGNLILATRFAFDFFFPELIDYAGVSADDWATGANPTMLTAVGDSLTDINRSASQSLTDIPKITGSSTLLYTSDDSPGYAAGLIAEPAGMGKFVFIAGRNYRWVGDDLKANLDVIYRYYFGMRNQY